MKYTIQAACGCHIGKIRKNNEDNFFFDGKCLEEINNGLKHPAWIEEDLKNGFCVAVFDGMGVKILANWHPMPQHVKCR